MTALKEYTRLESGGIWTEAPGQQPREAIVSFGNATLVISGEDGKPISHWSLPAVQRLNAGERPAIFQPDAGLTETLEIEDSTMIDAIEKVRKSIARKRPTKSKMRFPLSLIAILAVIALSIFYLPKVIQKQTLAAVPHTKRVEIGTTILGHMQSVSGQSCRSPQGRQALRQLHTRLLGKDAGGQLIVAPFGIADAIALPGGIIVLDETMSLAVDEPAVTAGYILVAHAERIKTDPLHPVLESAGLSATFKLFTTGELPDQVLKHYANAVMMQANSHVDPSSLTMVFDTAQVQSAPYGVHRNIPELVTNDPMSNREAPIILGDGAWVSLQGICDS